MRKSLKFHPTVRRSVIVRQPLEVPEVRGGRLIKVPETEDGEKLVLKNYKSRFSVMLRQKLADVGAYIAGGFLTSHFYDNTVYSDIDIFFRNKEGFETIKDLITSYAYRKQYHETDNAISFSDVGTPLQLISFQFGEPESVINTFDLSVCQIAMDFGSNEFYYGRLFKNNYRGGIKMMNYNEKSSTPFQTLFRIIKYKRKGFDIPDWDLLKATLAIASLKLETFGDLKRELKRNMSNALIDEGIKELLKSEDIDNDPFSLGDFIALLKMNEMLKGRNQEGIYE